MVALTGGPEGDTLIRRAARIAARTKGADLLAVHVTRNDGLAGGDPANLARQRALVESLGGTYHQVVGDDVAAALLDFARGVNATQLVLGASRRGRLAQVFSPRRRRDRRPRSPGRSTSTWSPTRRCSRGRPRSTAAGAGLSRSRRGRRVRAGRRRAAAADRCAAHAARAASCPCPATSCSSWSAVVAVALVGGLYPALFAAVAGSLLLNYYFTPPIHRFTIAERENVLALRRRSSSWPSRSASSVDLAARRTREAARARAEAETLSTLAGSVLRGAPPAAGAARPAARDLRPHRRHPAGTRPEAPPARTSQRDPTAWRIAAPSATSPA